VTEHLDPDLERAAGAVADETAIDWGAETTRNPGLHRALTALQAIENLAAAHREAREQSGAGTEATPESAVRGTPEQCAEQIAAYLEAGVKHLVFCPYNYELEQVQRLAVEVLPKLGTRVAD